MTYAELQERQALPLEFQIRYAQVKIQEFYEAHNGQVYVAYSGGADSDFLLALVREMYPEVPAVFCDTGLEFREIRDHVATRVNVVWLKPKLRFDQVIEKYGYVVVSKEVSMAINRYRNTKSEHQKQLRLHGGTNENTGKKQTTGVIPEKWKYLIHAPFKIGEQCCYFMKKAPFTQYEKETGRKPFVGTMAADSMTRRKSWLKYGCNVFDTKKSQSRPLSIMRKEGVWAGIAKMGCGYSCIYDKGYDCTGCIFCLIGPNVTERFELLKETHPAEHRYCMGNLGIAEVLEWIGMQKALSAWNWP